MVSIVKASGLSRDELRIQNRLQIIFVIREFNRSGSVTYYDRKPKRVVRRNDESGIYAFGELLKATQFSRGVLNDHLRFLVKKRYLFRKKGVYRFNPEFEDDFRRIGESRVAWLGTKILLKSRRAFNQFLRRELGEDGYEPYKDEIMGFTREEKRLRGIEL
jgi:hypothetical protein